MRPFFTSEIIYIIFLSLRPDYRDLLYATSHITSSTCNSLSNGYTENESEKEEEEFLPNIEECRLRPSPLLNSDRTRGFPGGFRQTQSPAL